MKKDMIKLKLIIYFLILLIFASCGTINEGFSNQKKDNTDEFLVKKKSPLVMPPNYDELPLPSAKDNQVNENDSKVKKLITNNTEINNSNSKVSSETDLKNIVLDKIKNN